MKERPVGSALRQLLLLRYTQRTIVSPLRLQGWSQRLPIEWQKRDHVVYAETVDDVDETKMVLEWRKGGSLSCAGWVSLLERAGSEAEWVLGSGHVWLKCTLPILWAAWCDGGCGERASGEVFVRRD